MAGLGLGRRTRIAFWLIVQGGLMTANFLHYLLVREGQEGFGSWGFVVTVVVQFLHFATAAYGPSVLTNFAGVVGAVGGLGRRIPPPVTRAELPKGGTQTSDEDEVVGYDADGNMLDPTQGRGGASSRAPTADLEVRRD